MALNQLKYDQLETGSIYPITASYAISSSAGSGGTTLITGSTYPITSSWSNNSISSSYSLNSTTSSYSNTSTSASYSRNSSTASYLDPISQSLIPSTGSTYSLGSPTNKWKDLYVSTGSIYIGDTVLSTSGSTLYANTSPVVTLNTASGQIEVSGFTSSLSASFSTNAGLFNNTSSTVFATTGSNNFIGNQTVQGNITVVGSLIAQQYVVSSSISYFTSSNFDGSTKFGDTESDTHQFTGSLRSPNITGSLLGTSSFSNNSISASYSGTASVALVALTSSYINVATNAVSSSFASTSSYNLNSVSSSYSLTASFATNAGSSLTTGSTYPITASWSNNSISSSYSTFAVSATSATSATSANTSTSASYATVAGSATSATSANTSNSATSASYSLSSSYSVNSTTSTSSSFASTASYNLNSISSSFAATSSYNLNSVSSSYALTASFALNGGGGGTTLTTGSSYPITSSWAINAITASYALNSAGGGGSVQTGNIANQTILYNVTTSQDNVISGLNLSSNKWGVTVVEEWNSGSIVGDIYYNSCSLLMHFSGSNSSTTFIDNSPNNFTVTPNNGAFISTAQSKFGGSSGFFDGTDDYLSITDNSVFDFGSGDFTIEYWEYRTVSTLYKPVISRNNNGYPPFMLGWSESGNVNFFISSNGSSWDVASAVSMGTLTTNVWTHYAVTRQGNTFRTFQNGTQISTFTSTATLPAGSGTLQIGRYSSVYYYQGYLDELRISKGVARYTGSFTTSSNEFYNNLNVTQLQTKYIGLVGGLNDSTVDYGVEKLSDSSLKIRKMTATGQPLSGSGSTLSASVDRVYVNVLDYTNVMVTSSYALTASYVLGGIQTGSISNQTILYNVTTSQENTITGLDLSGNKWDVSVIEEWNSASVAGDLNYSSCSLLMHFSGSDGSTTFTDNSPTPKSFTRGGNAQVSTVQSKFGGSSLYLDGSGDYITTTYNSAAFDWWTTDYTIECFIYPNNSSSLATGTVPLLIGNMDPGGSGANYWSFGPNNSKQLSFYYFNGAGIYVTSTETVTVGQWNHIAATKNSTGIRLFINGTASVSSASVSGTPGSSVSYPLTIGQYYNASINAYVDEVRITKGVARYTASFTVPNSAFPDTQGTTPQYATKYVGLVGGINDSNVDYGVEKLSDTSLKIRKMTASGQPLSGSGALSASVDRVYVNVLNYKEVQTTAQSASYAVTSSYLINAPSGESFHPFLLG
jgi:hypothetical protein